MPYEYIKRLRTHPKMKINGFLIAVEVNIIVLNVFDVVNIRSV